MISICIVENQFYFFKSLTFLTIADSVLDLWKDPRCFIAYCVLYTQLIFTLFKLFCQSLILLCYLGDPSDDLVHLKLFRVDLQKLMGLL